MITFKKFDNQETVQVKVKIASGTLEMTVGELFTYVPETQVGAKITKLSEVKTAFAAGNQVYLIAQGDQITEASPLEYKTYKVSDKVNLSTTAKIVVAYKVTDATNLEGYAAEAAQ